MPLILSGPGLMASQRVSRQVELLGLAPTLLELTGIEAPSSFVGTSFASLARSGAGEGSETVFSEAMHSGGRRSRLGVVDTWTVTSCRKDGWKYIHDSEDNGAELFDLTHDPNELVDLADQRPARAAEMRELIEEHRRKVDREASKLDPDDSGPTAPEDEVMRRRLAALGYL
ncbi:MAG: hypothetical protein AMS21_11185 [Gemmatimonas sp. SG8_38_2]|nr:MAG: hypothetical protein AMS21_11185 [Gemmatimonas sp. SG8_38_2]